MVKKSLTFATVAMLVVGSLFTGCGINNNKALVKINGGEDVITLGEANFAARYMQAVYEKMYDGYFGEDMWSTDLYGLGTTFEQDIKIAVQSNLEDDYVCIQHAAEYGVELSEDDKKAIEEAADKFIELNDAKVLKLMSADKDTVVKYLTNCTIATRTKKAIKEAANVTVTKDEAWQRTFTYVLFKMDAMVDASGNTAYPTEEFIASQKEKAEAVAAAADFNAAISDIDSNNAASANYVYTKGETEDPTLDMAVINAAEALTVEGQVSPVIEVPEVGYYVVRLNSDFDESATNDKMENIKYEKERDAYNEKKDEWFKELDWSFNDKAWSKVKFDTMFNFTDK